MEIEQLAMDMTATMLKEGTPDVFQDLGVAGKKTPAPFHPHVIFARSPVYWFQTASPAHEVQREIIQATGSSNLGNLANMASHLCIFLY